MSIIEESIQFMVGQWRVDAALRQITRGDEIVKIDPRNLRVLLLLAARPGQVVSQTEIEEHAWTGLVVTPNSVYQSIAQLRRAFGQDDVGGRYIETVSRRGYRLTAPVTQDSCVSPPSSNTNDSISPPPAVGSPVVSQKRVWFAIAVVGAAVVSLVVVAILYFRADSSDRTAAVVSVAPTNADPGKDKGDKFFREYIATLENNLAKLSVTRGPDDVTLLPLTVRLGNNYQFISNPKKTESITQRGIEILIKLDRERSPEGVELTATLAEALVDMGRYAEADKLLQHAIEMSIEVNGEFHDATIWAIEQGANSLIAQGRFSEAEAEARRAVAAYATQSRAIAARAAGLKSTLVWALTSQHKYDEAISIGTAALNAVSADDPPVPYPLALANRIVGEAFNEAGRYREAESFLNAALNLFNGIPHCVNDRVRAESGLGFTLFKQGRLPEAEKILTKANQTMAIVGDGWRERLTRQETAQRLAAVRDAIRHAS